MLRSDFLLRFFTGIPFLKKAEALLPSTVFSETGSCVQPPFLQKGDQIGIPSPAGYMFPEELIPAMRLMESWGFRTVPGKGIGQQWGNMGGQDLMRKDDFQEMLDNPEIKAILCARGGYGLIRFIDKLDFSAFRRHPKWIIGFSDITVLHAHLNKQVRAAAIHAKMCNSIPAALADADPDVRKSIQALRPLLTGERIPYDGPIHPANVPGKARGELVGGNLSVLYGMIGSVSMPSTRGKILFLEDAGEYLYHYDRMCWSLERAGIFKGLAGLILGGFRVKPSEDPKEEFPLSLPDLMLEKVKKYHFPVAFDFPTGHQKYNMPLKCGAVHELVVTQNGSRLQEILL